MRRFWVGLLLAVLPGCAAMDEFFFDDDHYDMIVWENESPTAHSPALSGSSQPAPVTPVSYHPQTTREPELLDSKK